MKLFGLLTSPPGNLGDEIQSLAARAFLPRVDRLVSRENLNSDPGPDVARLPIILNGWFMHRPQCWPPHPKIAPLLISMHLSPEKTDGRFPRLRPTIAEVMLRHGGADYLRSHGPVGARDQGTLAMLRAHDIDAYYSGCLTLTLERNSSLPREDIVIACDLPRETLAILRRRVKTKIVSVSHRDTQTHDPLERIEKAEALLSLYGQAKAVVGTRLHCVLPCLAQETPVLFVLPQRMESRLAIGMELVRHCSLEDLAAGRENFDFEAPAPNDPSYRPVREALIRNCQSWITGVIGAPVPG